MAWYDYDVDKIRERVVSFVIRLRTHYIPLGTTLMQRLYAMRGGFHAHSKYIVNDRMKLLSVLFILLGLFTISLTYFVSKGGDVGELRDPLLHQYSRPFRTQLYAIPGAGALSTAEENRMRIEAVTYFETSPEGIIASESGDVEDIFDEWLRNEYLAAPAAYRKGDKFADTVQMISDTLSNPVCVAEPPNLLIAAIMGKYGPNASDQEENLKRVAKLYITGGSRDWPALGIGNSVDNYWDTLSIHQRQDDSTIFTTMINLPRTSDETPAPTTGISHEECAFSNFDKYGSARDPLHKLVPAKVVSLIRMYVEAFYVVGAVILVAGGWRYRSLQRQKE